MRERVQKILAGSGVASRRRAEQMILDGRVQVNGTICSLGDTADRETDRITVDGVPIPDTPRPVYIMLNKPRGYVSTASDEKGRPTVLDLVDCGVRVYPVGRLDMDSEGLLLLTNDGELTNRLLHPAHRVDKTYLVWLRGADADRLLAMGESMDIDGYRISPADVEVQERKNDRARIRVTIHEGRNRQIRKMAETCGMSVMRLMRIEEGTLSLGDLPSGAWRYLSPSEIEELKQVPNEDFE